MGSERIVSPSSTRKPKLNNLGLIQLLGRTRASQGTAPPSRTVRELSHLCFRSEGASTRQAVGTQILIKPTRPAPTISACLPGFPCPKSLGYSRPYAFTWVGWTSTSTLRGGRSGYRVGEDTGSHFETHEHGRDHIETAGCLGPPF